LAAQPHPADAECCI